MMAIGKIICSMEKVNMSIKMEEFTKATGSMIKLVDSELIIICLEEGMKVNGVKIHKMVEVKRFILMDHHMMVIIKMGSNMAKVSLFGLIKTSTKVIGFKVK